MESVHNDCFEEPMMGTYNGRQVATWSKDRLATVFSEMRSEDVPWAIDFLVNKLVDVKPVVEETAKKHVWDSYELSREILAMMPPVRQQVVGNYRDELTEILDRKYKFL